MKQAFVSPKLSDKISRTISLLHMKDDQQSQNQDEKYCDNPLGRERALAQKHHTQSRKIREGRNDHLGLRY